MIGLYQFGEKVYNTALMQISAYYKQRGERVEWYSPIFDYEFDKVYCSTLFQFTPRNYFSDKMIIGGSGSNDITLRLPKEIEDCGYDYSIYPDCDRSFVWYSRGCVNNCPFCIVRKKEGYIYTVDPKNLNLNGKYVEVLDNNFFANPEWKSASKHLMSIGQKVKFSGIDVRTITEEQTMVLSKFRHQKQICIAWDNPRENLCDKIEKMTKIIKTYKVICYVLIGYWSTEDEDLMRVMKLKEMGVDAFAMPYNKKDKYQKSFARWVNHKAIFNSCTWEDYNRGRNEKQGRT